MFTITIEDQNGQVADTFSFDHGSYVVGRLDECDVILPSSSVSREHARIFIENGRCYIEDLGSANGVIVDGQKVLKSRDLGTASQIRVGDYYLYLEYKNQSRMKDQDVRSTLFIDSGTEHHKLVRINDSFAGEEFSLSEQENTIGRTDDNFILLSDTSISRRHSVIYHHGELYSVEDCGSSNGTRVNGVAVQSRTELTSGDRVEFGHVEFIFAAGDETINPSQYAATGSNNDLVTYAGFAVLLLVGLALGGAVVFGIFQLSQDDVVAAEQSDPLQARISELLQTGESQLEIGNWDAANAAFQEALDLSPQHPDARRLQDRVLVEREGAELLARGEMLSEEGRHSEARSILLEIPEDTLASRRAQPTLEHINRTVTYNLRTDANRMLRQDDTDLTEVHQKLSSVLEIAPEDQEAKDLIADVEERMSDEGIEFEPFAAN